MASGTQVPWTSPGGEPCCCGSVLPEACVKPLTSGFVGIIISEATAKAAIESGQLRMTMSYSLPAFQVQVPRPAGFSYIYVTGAVTGGVSSNATPIPGFCAFSIFSQNFVDGTRIDVRPDGSTSSIDYDDVVNVALVCELVQDGGDYIAGVSWSLGYDRISTGQTGPTLYSLDAGVSLFGQDFVNSKSVKVFEDYTASLLSEGTPQLSMFVSLVP